MSENDLKQVGLVLYDLDKKIKALQDKKKSLVDKATEILESDKAKEIGVFEKEKINKKTGKKSVIKKFKLMDGTYLSLSNVDPVMNYDPDKLQVEITEDFGGTDKEKEYYDKFNDTKAIKYVEEKYKEYPEELDTLKEITRKGYPKLAITKS